jgi:hypothetical protein
MKYNICVVDPDSSIGWLDVFQVLGIKRCQAMLGDIGVPDKIVSELSGVTKAAYEFWQSDWGERDEMSSYVSNPTTKPDTMADYYSRVRQRVERAFSIVESDYGEDVADALCKWADRLFVDPKGSRQLSFWRSILLWIEDDPIDSQDVVPEALLPKLDMIDDVIWQYLGYPAELHFEKQLALANQIPLSPIEKRMIELEVTQPNDPAEVDLSVLLHVISQRYRVYLVWKNFLGLLSSSELEGILQWARKVAKEKGETSKLAEGFLTIPDLA